MTSLLPVPSQQWLDQNGAPLAGGQVFTYIVNSTSPKSCWLDPNRVSLAQNPTTLDADGRCVLYGAGTYRLMVFDALGVLQDDGLSAATMDDSAINAALLPALQSSTWQEFRDTSGTTAAINSAIAGVSLLPGPQGVPGSPGPQGVQGVPGLAGSSSSPTTVLNANPGYFYDTHTQFLIGWGTGIADNTGVGTVSFAKPFLTVPVVTVTPLFNPVNLTARIEVQSFGSFVMFFENTDNTVGSGTGVGGGCQFNWMAMGIG